MAAEDTLFRPLGDQGVRVALGPEIGPEVHARIRRFCMALERDPIPGVVEWVPGYVTVGVYYRPWVIDYDDLCARLGGRLAATDVAPLPPARRVALPVYYGGVEGPDLEEVAALHGLTPGELIALHTQPTYRVHFLGFLPGFAYLGGLPDLLTTPRLDTPRARVRAGSVGIAGRQTGVYPCDTPGGWRIIGRTSVVLYDPAREPPALLRAGDEVRFFAEGVPDAGD